MNDLGGTARAYGHGMGGVSTCACSWTMDMDKHMCMPRDDGNDMDM